MIIIEGKNETETQFKDIFDYKGGKNGVGI